MTIDNYAPCPCGSGKKMKFCKCVDQPQEYEKIVRLIEGGQELAALDRVNQLLAKTPNTAWLLAIKGELALSLREVATFKDTAGRFLKLKPDNPLALIMRAFVALLDGEPHETAARYLLEGLAESREGMPRLAMTTTQLLCDQLRLSSKSSLRFFWSRLSEQFHTQLDQQRATSDVLAVDNLLAMSPVPLVATPPGAAWTERANEVAALISAFRHAQAETKLRSILRDYPDQASPLSRLLEVQMILLDQAGATATARKLGTLRELPESERDYFAALALEIEKDQVGIRSAARVRYCEIASDEAAREALSKLDLVEQLSDEMAQQTKQLLAHSVRDEVPATTTYSISVPKTTPAGDTYVADAGTVALFGRQTDKPARALIMLFDMPDTREIFDRVVAAVGPVADIEDPAAPRTYAYVEVLERTVYKKNGTNLSSLSIQEHSEVVVEDFLNLPFPVLDGLSPLEAVEKEPLRAAVRAVLTHFEGAHHIVTELGTIERIYERLQFTRPKYDIGGPESSLKVRTLLELTRMDIASLSDEQLGQLFVAAMMQEIENLSYHLSLEVLRRPTTEKLAALRAPALNVLTRYAESPDKALLLLEQLEQALVAANQSPGPAIIRRFSILTDLGRDLEARDTLSSAFSKYPNDPQLISLWQYLSQQMQRGYDSIVDDGQLLSRMSRHSDTEPESGLVLPGQETAAEPGKSKLWLPGS